MAKRGTRWTVTVTFDFDEESFTFTTDTRLLLDRLRLLLDHDDFPNCVVTISKWTPQNLDG